MRTTTVLPSAAPSGLVARRMHVLPAAIAPPSEVSIGLKWIEDRLALIVGRAARIQVAWAAAPGGGRARERKA